MRTRNALDRTRLPFSSQLLQQEPPEQVAAIWEAKHAAEERRVGATLSGQAWAALSRHARSKYVALRVFSRTH